MEIISQSEAELRLERLGRLEARGIHPYPYEFQHSCSLVDVYQDFDYVDQVGEKARLRLFGRVTLLNVMEHGLVVVLEQQETTLQFVLLTEVVGASVIEDFRQDVLCGDWIGFSVDRIFRTHDGVMATRVRRWYMLAPCLLPLAKSTLMDNFYDPDLNPIVDSVGRRRLIMRSRVVRYIRRFLEDQYDCLEVKTPTTRASCMEVDRRCRSESYLRGLIAGGLEAVYEIGDMAYVPRPDSAHELDTQTLICYRMSANMSDMLELTERLISEIVLELNGSNGLPGVARGTQKIVTEENGTGTRTGVVLEDRSKRLDASEQPQAAARPIIGFAAPWNRRTIYDMALEATGVDFRCLASREDAFRVARESGVDIGTEDARASIGSIVLEIVKQRVYPGLIQPTFVLYPPSEECPLAKRHPYNPMVADQFELIINGVNVGLARSELSDPRELSNSENTNVAFRDAGQWITLKRGLPPSAGLWIDIDLLAAQLVV